MNQIVTEEHSLQRRDLHGTHWGPWQTEIAGMHDESRRLAHLGRLAEALLTAEKEHQESYGHTRDVEYRIVSVRKTTSFRGSLERALATQ